MKNDEDSFLRWRSFRAFVLAVASLCLFDSSCGPYETSSSSQWSACRQPDPSAEYDGASLLLDGDRTWVARVDSPMAIVPRIVLRRVDWSRPADRANRPVAEVVGTNPSLVHLSKNTLGLLYRTVDQDGNCQLVFRRFSTERRKWSKPVPVSKVPGITCVANGRLLKTTDGALIFPATHFAVPDSLPTARVTCYRSENDGKSWEVLSTPFGPEVRMPAIAEASPGTLVMIMNIYGELHRARSASAGKYWGSPEPLGILAKQTPHALLAQPDRSELVLVWTEQMINPREALPKIRPLRSALSTDAGKTWTQPANVVVRPGRVPQTPACDVSSEQLQLAFELTRTDERVPVLATFPMHKLRRQNAPAAAEHDYVQDAGQVREALRILVSHTLQRPKRARYLFVESYFMRSLLTAHEVLIGFEDEHADWLDTEAGIQTAIEYADSLVASQDSEGYWHLGYGDRWLADMAVAVGVFKSLEPYVDEEHLRRYQESVEKFLAAVERDGMFLASGAVGVGKPRGHNAPLNRTPYLVSTALVGVEMRAWLYTRTGDPAFREAALASLEFLLASIHPDGSVPPFPKETPLQEAVYLQEGVMAADMLLNDESILERCKERLPVHVDWILSLQNDNGTWGLPEDGSLQRSTMLINFLIWYDQRCEAREDVRRALRRASSALNLDLWRQFRFFDDHIGGEVYRGLAGRPMAALVRGSFVF